MVHGKISSAGRNEGLLISTELSSVGKTMAGGFKRKDLVDEEGDGIEDG